MASEKSGWLRPTLTLVCAWAIGTAGMIALQTATSLALPTFVAKTGPFVLAGFVTGWLVPVSTRRPKIIAAAVLVLVAALCWTAFGAVTNDAGIDRALVLLGASLPVMVAASLWAYLAMFLAGRRHEAPADHRDPELSELEQELRSELEQELLRELGDEERTNATQEPTSTTRGGGA